MLLTFPVVQEALNPDAFLELSLMKFILKLLVLLVIISGFLLPQALARRVSSSESLTAINQSELPKAKIYYLNLFYLQCSHNDKFDDIPGQNTQSIVKSGNHLLH